MFICRRFLQLGLLTALLGGCNNIPKTEGKPLENSGQISKADVIRIGPTAPEAQADSADASAALTSSGQLRPYIQAYAQTLASERSLPLDQVLAILVSARKNETVIRLISPAPPDKKSLAQLANLPQPVR